MISNHKKHHFRILPVLPIIFVLALSMGNFSSALCQNDALPEPPEDKNIAEKTASDEPANTASSQDLGIGGNASTITVNYTYSNDGGSRCIGQITGITAAKNQGWCYVSPDVSLDVDQITLTNNGAKAVIPFTYYASIGSGLMPWDDLIVIDLYQLPPSPAENCI